MEDIFGRKSLLVKRHIDMNTNEGDLFKSTTHHVAFHSILMNSLVSLQHDEVLSGKMKNCMTFLYMIFFSRKKRHLILESDEQLELWMIKCI